MNTKTSVYAKRNSISVPAPLESDSDPDFNPGEYIPEPTKKPKRTRSAPSSTAPKMKRRSEVLGVSASTNASSKSKKGKMRMMFFKDSNEPNPLLEYFGELDLQSESEDENPPNDRNGGDNEGDVQGSSEVDEDEQGERPMPKAWVGFLPESKTGTVSPTPSSNKAKAIDDDSATESDSGCDEILKRKLYSTSEDNAPNKRLKLQAVDGSATESDSDDPALSQPPLNSSSQYGKSQTRDSDSETESDSEAEGLILANPCSQSRPAFPLAPGQHFMGPLVLDRNEGYVVPASINTYLREYQREGVKFFYKQFREGRGGLLGDDMGLGKTIQVISFLSAIMQKSGTKSDKDRRRKHVSKLQDDKEWRKHRRLPPANESWPTCLIIAPSTVVHNWERELETWGYFEVGMYTGSPKEREPVLKDFKLGRLDVVLTTFDLARKDIDLLDSLPWTCIFVDEVHRVKNLTSKIAMAYHQFACPRRFGLTGTTIQNSYKEMWTILDWTNPGQLGTARQWQGYVVRPLTEGQSAGASEEERVMALIVARILKTKLLPKFFLRRTKDIIKDQLPQKMDQVVFCPLTEKQITAYKNILNIGAVQTLIHKDDPCSCGSRKQRKFCCYPVIPGDLFKYMSILIKLSNHLGLILPGPNDTAEQTARHRALAEVAFPDGSIPKYGMAILQPQYCGKWAVLDLLLKEWRKDPSNKVLVFTKSVKLLEMLQFHLSTRGYGFLKLDGSTRQTERMPMIDQFHNDPRIFVFLISTLAGGTGLNLTGANKVVIFDPNWNPAHDLQAMDRAFRFGQTRDVSVFRLLGAGSIEELIYARQIYKQQQMAIGYDASVQTRYFEGIQGDNTKKGELFGIENIFKLHEDKLATKMTIEKASLAELDWALANMQGGSNSKKHLSKANREIIEADTKIGKDEANLKGLGILLFDDSPPLELTREQDSIQKTLNDIGVTYSHMNDEILVPSRIEEERTKKTVLKLRQKKKSSKFSRPSGGMNDPSSPAPVWPPKRRHHKSPPTPEEQLVSRHQALVELGMISSPSDIPDFAHDFARQPPEEQRAIIAELDKYVKLQAEDSD